MNNIDKFKQTKSRRNQNQIANETKFKDFLYHIFDIVHGDVMQTMPGNDRLFLNAQRIKGMRGYLSAVNRNYVAKQQRKCKRVEEGRRKEVKILCKKEQSVVTLESNSDNNVGESNDDLNLDHTKLLPDQKYQNNIQNK